MRHGLQTPPDPILFADAGLDHEALHHHEDALAGVPNQFADLRDSVGHGWPINITVQEYYSRSKGNLQLNFPYGKLFYLWSSLGGNIFLLGKLRIEQTLLPQLLDFCANPFHTSGDHLTIKFIHLAVVVQVNSFDCELFSRRHSSLSISLHSIGMMGGPPNRGGPPIRLQKGVSSLPLDSAAAVSPSSSVFSARSSVRIDVAWISAVRIFASEPLA